MMAQNSAALDSKSFDPAIAGKNMAPVSDSAWTQEPEVLPEVQGGSASLLSRYSGRLAVGAAVMLGLAAFYRWRESKLGRDDEEINARLKRITDALDGDEPKRRQQ